MKSSMKTRQNKWILALALPLLCCLSFFYGYGASKEREESLPQEILSREILLKEIESVRQSNVSLQDLLRQRDETIMDLLATTKQVPEYVVKTETVIAAQEPIYITVEPETYEFRLSNGLLVAKFSQDESYVYETADLSLTANLVISDTSALSLQANSSLEPEEEREIQIDNLTVQAIGTEERTGPNFTIGGTYEPYSKNSGFYVGLETIRRGAFGFLHPRIDLQATSVGVSIDAIQYNLADRIRPIEDLMLGAGVGYSTDRTVSGSISIGTKL